MGDEANALTIGGGGHRTYSQVSGHPGSPVGSQSPPAECADVVSLRHCLMFASMIYYAIYHALGGTKDRPDDRASRFFCSKAFFAFQKKTFAKKV